MRPCKALKVVSDVTSEPNTKSTPKRGRAESRSTLWSRHSPRFLAIIFRCSHRNVLQSVCCHGTSFLARLSTSSRSESLERPVCHLLPSGQAFLIARVASPLRLAHHVHDRRKGLHGDSPLPEAQLKHALGMCNAGVPGWGLCPSARGLRCVAPKVEAGVLRLCGSQGALRGTGDAKVGPEVLPRDQSEEVRGVKEAPWSAPVQHDVHLFRREIPQIANRRQPLEVWPQAHHPVEAPPLGLLGRPDEMEAAVKLLKLLVSMKRRRPVTLRQPQTSSALLIVKYHAVRRQGCKASIEVFQRPPLQVQHVEDLSLRFQAPGGVGDGLVHPRQVEAPGKARDANRGPELWTAPVSFSPHRPRLQGCKHVVENVLIYSTQRKACPPGRASSSQKLPIETKAVVQGHRHSFFQQDREIASTGATATGRRWSQGRPREERGLFWALRARNTHEEMQLRPSELRAALRELCGELRPVRGPQAKFPEASAEGLGANVPGLTEGGKKAGSVFGCGRRSSNKIELTQRRLDGFRVHLVLRLEETL